MLAFIRRPLRAAVSSMMFFIRNCWCAKKLTPFNAARHGAFVVEPFSRTHLGAVDRLFFSVNGGTRLGVRRKAILWLFGSRLCLVARDVERREVVGVVIYYFIAKDWRDSIVHEGFIGLQEGVRSVGMGTFMRRHALENFARSGLSGVSSRISVGNLPSLKSNEKLGFIPVETYFDSSMREKRHYLICSLSQYGESLKRTP